VCIADPHLVQHVKTVFHARPVALNTMVTEQTSHYYAALGSLT
jgi:hypothetical protein